MQKNERGLRCLESDGCLTVYLEGDIDHHSAQTIRSRIDTKLFLTRPRELVLDLSRVNFMDSAGLGLILGRFTKAAELGVQFRLASPNRHIQKILDLAGMERLIPITAARSS
ncbi:MAG: STAS domain-containing protein [Ruminococcaceae bacterium]|nr:STAS domain-containing protein [Oscillospiraceae bacterium]